MIDKILILGIRRAGELIPDSDIAQMVGRCGRSYTESGEATIIVPFEDEENARKYLFSKPKSVMSSFSKLDDVSFHFLPEMKRLGSTVSKDHFDAWFSRSLAHLQGMSVNWDDLVESLVQDEVAIKFNDKLILSELGRLSCDYYLRPHHVFQMKERMETMSLVGNLDQLSLSWILSFEKIYKNFDEDYPFQEFLSEMSGRRMSFEDKEDVDAYVWFCIFSGRSPKSVKAEIISHRKDLPRMMEALRRLAKILNLSISEDLEDYEICGLRKIPIEFARIAKSFPDAKKSLLFELESFSIHNLMEMKEDFYKIERYGSDELREYARSKSIKA